MFLSRKVESHCKFISHLQFACFKYNPAYSLGKTIVRHWNEKLLSHLRKNLNLNIYGQDQICWKHVLLFPNQIEMCCEIFSKICHLKPSMVKNASNQNMYTPLKKQLFKILTNQGLLGPFCSPIWLEKVSLFKSFQQKRDI